MVIPVDEVLDKIDERNYLRHELKLDSDHENKIKRHFDKV